MDRRDGVVMRLLRVTDGVAGRQPVFSQIIIGIGEAWAGLAGLRAFSRICVGFPGCRSEFRKLFLQFAVGRITKLIEEAPLEFGLVEPRAGAALARFEAGGRSANWLALERAGRYRVPVMPSMADATSVSRAKLFRSPRNSRHPLTIS